MNLQKTILSQYMLLNGRPTFKQIALDTNIQVTRVFRIFNGSTMKLSEYETFRSKVITKMGLSNSLEAIAFDCSMKLSPSAIKELEVFLKRKIEIWKLVHTKQINNSESSQLLA